MRQYFNCEQYPNNLTAWLFTDCDAAPFTNYALLHWTREYNPEHIYTGWWLRSAYSNSAYYAGDVFYTNHWNHIYDHLVSGLGTGTAVEECFGVRPAMWVDFSSVDSDVELYLYSGKTNNLITELVYTFGSYSWEDGNNWDYSSIKMEIILPRNDPLEQNIIEKYTVTLPDGFSFKQDELIASAPVSFSAFDSEHLRNTDSVVIYPIYSNEMKHQFIIEVSNENGFLKRAKGINIKKNTSQGHIEMRPTAKVNYSGHLHHNILTDPSKYFIKQTNTYYNDLAILGCTLSQAVYVEEFIEDSLSNLGFSNIAFYNNFSAYDIGVGFATKDIIMNNGIEHIVMVVKRGTYGIEWVGNFDVVGSDLSVHNNFQSCANSVIQRFDTYKAALLKKNIDLTKNTRLFICGHSRGGAVANLFAHEMNSTSRYGSSNVYAYTFATPNCTKNRSNDSNIFNYVYKYDFVGFVPQGYYKHGTTYIIGGETESSCPEPVKRKFEELTENNRFESIGNSSAIKLIVYEAEKLNLEITELQKIIGYLISNPDSVRDNFIAKAHGAENYCAWTIKNENAGAMSYDSYVSWLKRNTEEWIKKLGDDLEYDIKHPVASILLSDFRANWVQARFNNIICGAVLYLRAVQTANPVVRNISCPVDVSITDEFGNTLASIENHMGFEIVKDIVLFGDGTSTFIISSNQTSLKVVIKGNDVGTMNITSLLLNDNNGVERYAFTFDIPVTNGEIFTGSLNDLYSPIITSDNIVYEPDYTFDLESTDDFEIDENGILIRYTGDSSEVIIPEQVIGIGEYAFAENKIVKTIRFISSISSIGPFAFQNCSNLEKLILPDYIEEIAIDADAFIDCNVRIYCLYESYTARAISSAGYDFYVRDDDRFGLRYCIKNFEERLYLQTYNNNPEVFDIVVPEFVNEISRTAFAGNETIKTIIIPNGVIAIDDYVFQNCTSLESVEICGAVYNIGSYAFRGCTRLRKVYFSTGIDFLTIESTAFEGCPVKFYCEYDSVTARTISKLSYSFYVGDDTSFGLRYVIKNEAEMLSLYEYTGGPDVTEIFIPEYVEYIHGGWYSDARDAFYKQTQLKKVTITSGVKIIGGDAFLKCSGLNEVIILGTLEEIEAGAFRECSSLEKVSFPDSLRILGACIFDGCSSLKSIDLPDHITTIHSGSSGGGHTGNPTGTFYNCEGKIHCSLESETARTISDGYYNFYVGDDMSFGLRYVYQGDEEMLALYTYTGASDVTEISIPGHIEFIFGHYGAASFGAFHDQTQLEKITISTGIKKIGGEAFYNCTGLKTIIVEGTLEEIEPGAFSGCSSLETTCFPETLTKIGKCAFMNCSSLKRLDLPDNITSVSGGSEGTFCKCPGKIHCSIGSITAKTLSNTQYDFYVGDDMSFGLRYVRNIYQNNEEMLALYTYTGTEKTIVVPDYVESINRSAFSVIKTELETVVLPSITELPYDIFSGCSSLIDISIPSSLKTIGSRAFQNCTNLEKIYFPVGIESISISSDAFSNCPAKFYCELDSDTARALSLAGRNFYVGDDMSFALRYKKDNGDMVLSLIRYTGNDSAEEISIPDNIERIDYNALIDCNRLTILTVPNSVLSISDPIFSSVLNESIVIYCYENSYADQWAQLKRLNISYISDMPLFGIADFLIPNSTVTIEDNAFEGAMMSIVQIPNNCISIGAEAFKDCKNLTQISIPADCEIGMDAFVGCTKVYIFSSSGSFAEEYCRIHNNCVFVDESQ